MRLYQNKGLLILIGLFVVITSLIIVLDNSNNKISGDVTNTYVQVYQVQPKACAHMFTPGWNMVSFYCLGLFINRSIALQSIDGSYGPMFRYQANDANDPWKSYNPDLPNWTSQQLTSFDRLSGYWIYIYDNSSNTTSNSLNFTYDGVYSDSTLLVYKGWNFISYPRNVSSNITFILNGTPFTIVETYDISTNAWYYYINGSGGTITTFESFNGYWLNVSSNTTISIQK